MADPENEILSSKSDIKLVMNPHKTSTEMIELKNLILHGFPAGIDHNNLMEVLIYCIKHLASINKNLTGQQKKKLIIDSILLAIDETDSSSLEQFEPLIKIMIPNVIDNLIDVEKGKIKLNKKIKHLCCGCF